MRRQHKQGCLLWNTAIRRMTKDALSTKMVEMKRLFPLALMGLGLLIIFGVVGLWSFNQKAQRPVAAPLPEQIAGFTLTQSLVAEEAIDEFARLHGSDFPLVSGAKGIYGSSHAISLWVAGAATRSNAGEMVASMRDKIVGSPGRSPFVPVGERPDGSRTIYELDGMGQKHFYFQSGKLIVWLAANPESANETLNQVLNFYP